MTIRDDRATFRYVRDQLHRETQRRRRLHTIYGLVIIAAVLITDPGVIDTVLDMVP